MAAAFVVAFTLCLPSLSAARTLSEEWHSWKTRHEKVYVDRGEENVRQQIWIQNRARISAHNRGNTSFTLALNQFADMVSTAKNTLTLQRITAPQHAELPLGGSYSTCSVENPHYL